MGMYRKKPVVIEAHVVHMESDYDNISDYLNDANRLADWCGGRSFMMDDDEPFIMIETLEGNMRAIPTDFIIKGVNGEFYPCKEDIFWKTYDEASDEL